jgi:hypothetical protein
MDYDTVSAAAKAGKIRGLQMSCVSRATGNFMFRAEPGQGRCASRSSKLDESPATGWFGRSAHAGSKRRAAASLNSISLKAGRMLLLIAQ